MFLLFCKVRLLSLTLKLGVQLLDASSTSQAGNALSYSKEQLAGRAEILNTLILEDALNQLQFHSEKGTLGKERQCLHFRIKFLFKTPLPPPRPFQPAFSTSESVQQS